MGKSMRVAAIAFVSLMVLAACGSSGNAGSSGGSSSGSGGTPIKIALVYDIGGRGDKSFNDAAAAGLDKAKGQFNLDVKELSPNAGGTNRADLINLVATTGYKLVITVGFNFTSETCAAGVKFPDVKFGGVDQGIDHTTQQCPGAADLTSSSNVETMNFADNEGAYLVGAAAALTSKTHHIGFIGGVNVPLIQRFQAGFDAGAQKIDSSITIDHKYLTEPPNFNGFNDPADAKTVAESMYQNGADVVYHAAGGSGAGLFAAAEEYSTQNNTKVWAIGTDSDQYLSAPADQQPYILTSNLKRVDTAVFDTISDFVQGKFTGGSHEFNVANNGEDFSTSGGFIDSIKSQLDQLKSQIADGTITVPSSLSS
jgi:basic membrane protein A and related proteins